MSAGVDTLGLLAEKLDKLVNDIQNDYESFVDASTLYKSGKITEKEFLSKVSAYTVASSALGFLAVKVIMEIIKSLGRNGGASGTIQPGPAGMPPGMGDMTQRMGTAGFPVGAPPGGAGQSFDAPGTLPSPDPSLIPAPEPGAACASCGAQLRPGAKFCTKCGSKT